MSDTVVAAPPATTTAPAAATPSPATTPTGAPATATTPAAPATATPDQAPAAPAQTGSLANQVIPADATDPNAKPADGDAKPGEGKTGDDAPIVYTDFAMPEGIAVIPEEMGQFQEWAASNKLTQDEAQKAMDFHTAAVKRAIDEPTRAWNALQEQWIDAAKNDPEIGGPKLQQTLATLQKGVEVGMKPETAAKFRAALDVTGVGNNPDFIRGLAEMSKYLTEGGNVAGGPAAGKAPKTAADVLYPSHAQG